jgi:imidazolonepropionase-like amidohydrolase
MLAIRADRLFDGVDAVPVERAAVLVEAGRIVAVLSREEPPTGALTVDLGAVTLLPGLVDSHVHLVFDASDDPVAGLADTDDDRLLAAMRDRARVALSAGITTVRDLGDRGYVSLRLRDELADDPAGGPQVLAAGPPLTTGRGHCWFLGGETARGADAVRAAVREHADRGVDVIKVMATGGELTPGTSSHEAQFTADELRAAVDEAHRHGLPTTAHAHGAGGIANAVAAGIDMIEHGSFITADGAESDRAVIAAIGAARIPPVDTLRSVTSLAARACGLGDRKGRIAPGFDADLLAVAGDPLTDPAALTAVSAVFRAGVRVR